MINLTVKEKEDLREVYDCLIMKSEIESSLNRVYLSALLIVKKLRSLLKV